jgi:tRNA nucleotidyltransferase (CCA-adding enzyme)
MRTYLVGGAVRDRLLGRPVGERDWVVVGATPGALVDLGYRQVGRGFPVFLHPETGEEYALARTESKTGPGYRGFVVKADPAVTLEEDLARRDLTVNAMAEDDTGRVIDPWGGQADLAARLLRHVSPAFAEDPVRILRVARFAARFAPLGFSVHPDTLGLMRAMVAAGEADALVAERVWQETARALGEPRPDVFVATLRDCGALAVLFPEVAALFGVPQPAQWHPEIDTGAHLLLALRAAGDAGSGAEAAFAVLVHDLGKGTTPRAEWPAHRGHEERGVELLRALCTRLGVPNRFRELGLAVARYHGLAHRALELRPATVLRLLEGIDHFRRPGRLGDFLAACAADARGRTGHARDALPGHDYLRAAAAAAAAVRATDVAPAGATGEAIAAAMRAARIRAIRAVRAGVPGASGEDGDEDDGE